MEIDDETRTQIAKAQMSKELRLICRRQSLLRFHIDNDLIIYQQIQSQISCQTNAFVTDRHSLLPFEGDAAQMQVMTQSFFVDRFQQTRSEAPMNFDGSANDFSGQFVLVHRV